MVIKSCVICGEEFDAKNQAITCGKKCSYERKRNRAHERYFSDPELAREKSRERGRKYRASNLERSRRLNRERMRRPESRERANARRRERYATDPEYRDLLLAQARERYATDLEYRERKLQLDSVRRSSPEYQSYISSPEYRRRRRLQDRVKSQKRRARKRQLPDTLTPEQWQAAFNYFNGCCAVCGRQLNDMFGEFAAALDHWIPLSYEGDDNPGTVAENIIPLCHGVGGCNNSKNSTMPDEWLERQFGKRKARKIAQRIQAYFESLKELV